MNYLKDFNEMISFYRTLRQSSLSSSRFTKYLQYAIGEIILVVIGILIAIQINDWNENRLAQREKREILDKMHAEFLSNKNTVQNHKASVREILNTGLTLMNLIGESREVLAKHNINQLIYNFLPANELALSDNTIKSIVQSGQLKLFKNDPLIILLQEWNALSEIRETRLEKANNWSNNYFVPFLNNHVAFKEVDISSGYPWTGKSKLKPDYYPLFQMLLFENLLDNTLWYNQKVLERSEETELLIEKIITATKPAIPPD